VRSVGPFLLVCICACDGVIGQPNSLDSPTASGGPNITQLACTPASGSAPLKVTCSIAVTSAQAVSCVLNPGDGQPLIHLDDCLAASSVPFTLSQPGQFVITLAATDASQLENDATFTVAVAAKPDQPPTVNMFAAGSTSGGAPFTTALTWSVSDPDGDPLTCTLNTLPVDCTAGTAPWTVSAPGMETVTLTVTDPSGESATQTLTLTAKMPVGDLSISKVEYAQTIVSSTLRLVAGKPALLRVYAKSDTANLSAKVQAVATNGGTTLGTLMLTGPSKIPTADDPANLAAQFTGDLPAAWIADGLSIDVKIDVDDAVPETDETNNTAHLTPAVGKGNVFQLTAVPVIQSGMTPSVTDLEPALQRVWPIKSVDAMTRAPYTTSQVLSGSDANAWSNLLDEMGTVRQMDGSSRDYYGFVRVNYTYGVAGIGFIGDGAATGRDDSIETAQHELGHNMGRQHAPCGGAAGPDPNYPYAGAVIGSWGYDAVTKKLMAPSAYVDLMSYCNPSWVSDYNYKKVQTALEAQPFITGAPASPYVKTIVVAGVNGRLKPVYRVTARLDALTPTARTVRARFVDGRERVVPVLVREAADTPETEAHFIAKLEDLGPLARIDVLEGGRLIASHVPAFVPEAPRFEVRAVDKNTLSLTWDSRRWPYAAIAHLGDERTTLALGLTGGAQLIHTDGLPEGGQLEVSLSDGPDSVSAIVTR
jgi:hypothetical protein